jgi:adenosylmethionine-8-amino-7-oxononanoate aminotransferase
MTFPTPSRLLARVAGAAPPTAARGEGLYIFDDQGRRYADACGGAAVACLGHNHPAVTAAVIDQLRDLEFGYTAFFTTRAVEDLAAVLVDAAPDPLAGAFFVCGGSEAMEAALKIARQYHLEIGQPERVHFISRRQSYHGNTLGALAVSGHVARRAPYEPLLMPVSRIAPCYAYRGQAPGESAEAYGLRVADELEAAILAHPPGSVAGFIAETVVGATTGAVTAVPGYFRRIREICDRYGVLLILDEVMCGLGRCGRMFAFEDEGIVPDLVTLAKGLGAGYQPIGAVLVSEAIATAVQKGSGHVRHGHTYSGHTAACAAALAVQKVIAREDLIANVVARGEQLRAELSQALGDHAAVGDIRGRGLFRAVEFVADRETKTPFPREARLAERLQAAALDAGLMVYPGAGCADGTLGDHIILAPPFNVTPAQISEIVGLLAGAVSDLFSGQVRIAP